MSLFSKKSDPTPDPQEIKINPELIPPEDYNDCEKIQILRIIKELTKATEERDYYWMKAVHGKYKDDTRPAFHTTAGTWSIEIRATGYESFEFEVTEGLKKLMRDTFYGRSYSESGSEEYKACERLWMTVLRKPEFLEQETDKIIARINEYGKEREESNDEDEADEE